MSGGKKQKQAKRVSFWDLEKENPTVTVVAGDDPKQILIPKKEAAVLEGVLSGKSPGEAVIAAGYKFANRDIAKQFGESLVQKHSRNNGILTASLEAAGVTLEHLAKKLAEGLNATTYVKSGKDWIEVPDYNIRHKYLNTVLDIFPEAKAPKRLDVQQMSFEARLFMLAQMDDGSEDDLGL